MFYSDSFWPLGGTDILSSFKFVGFSSPLNIIFYTVLIAPFEHAKTFFFFPTSMAYTVLKCFLGQKTHTDRQTVAVNDHSYTTNRVVIFETCGMCSAVLSSPSLHKQTTHGYISRIYPHSPNCSTNTPIPHTLHLSSPSQTDITRLP